MLVSEELTGSQSMETSNKQLASGVGIIKLCKSLCKN
jgi:hypothetical protein